MLSTPQGKLKFKWGQSAPFCRNTTMQRAQFELHATLEDRHWWFVARRRIVGRIIDHLLAAKAAGRPSAANSANSARRPLVIDIGCGTGSNVAALANRYRCVGIDTSPDAIQWARQKFPDIQFIEGYAPQDLGGLVAEASMITLMDVLEHVEDDFQLLSSLLAECPVGAHLLLTVPADMSLWTRHDETFGHFRRYDAERFARLWQGLPVDCLLLSHFNSRLYPLVKAVRQVNRLFRRSSGEYGTDFSLPVAPVNWAFENLFAGEADRLFGCLTGTTTPYAHGVSLIAVLQRTAGPIHVRTKPNELRGDYFNPATGLLAAAV
jgi:SAM-dependent methyltransferase